MTTQLTLPFSPRANWLRQAPLAWDLHELLIWVGMRSLDGETVHVSQEKLAAELCVSERTVRRRIRELEDLGLLLQIGHRGSAYRVRWAELGDLIHGEPVAV